MRQTLREWSVWAIVAVWLCFWLAGHPRAHVDDLFFTGAGIELARGGHLENPWLGSWMETFGTRLYLVHPPFFPYVLAGWVKVFGSTTSALTGFHCAVSASASLALYGGLRRYGIAILPATVVIAPLALLFLSMGMRPDSTALLLVIAAQLCLARAGRVRWIAGSALSAAAVLTQSFSVALVVPLFFWHVIRLGRMGTSARLLAFPALAGVGITFLVFCWALPSSISEFLRVYLLHARLVTTPIGESASMVGASLFFGKEPLRQGPGWVVMVAACFFALRPGSPAAYLRSAWSVLGALALLGGVLYATYAVRYVFHAGLILAGITLGAAPAFRVMGAVAIVLAMAWSNAGLIASWLKSTAPADLQEIHTALATHPDRRLLVDAVAARIVFDFQLPSGAIDWSSRQPAGRGYSSTLRDKRPEELWIVSAWRLEHHVPDAGIRASRLHFLGRTFNSVDGEPTRVHVIP